MKRSAAFVFGVLAVMAVCAEDVQSARYAWRGYMLDVSRHFFTIDEIKRNLDAMAVAGVNVFHWHLTDDAGWRLQLDGFPELTKVGATTVVSSKRDSTMRKYDMDGAYGPFFYTKAEIRDVIAYAAARGIRVMPEIDIPGHSSAATRAYPQILCAGAEKSSVLCLGKDETIRLYEKILDEVLSLFPNTEIHLGGDECNPACWAKCADCQSRIRELKLRGEKGLQGWFMGHFARYLEAKVKRRSNLLFSNRPWEEQNGDNRHGLSVV